MIAMLDFQTVTLLVLGTFMVSLIQGCPVQTDQASLSSGVYHKTKVDSNGLCQRLCWYSASCRSCTWELRTGLCRLSKDSKYTSPGSFSVSQHHIYTDVLSPPCLTSDHGCERRPCPENEVCIPTEAAKSNICLKLETTSLEDIASSLTDSVVGSESMTSSTDVTTFDPTGSALSTTNLFTVDTSTARPFHGVTDGTTSSASETSPTMTMTTTSENPQDGCQAGWAAFNSSCYWFSAKRLNFEKAQENCTLLGGHLAFIDDAGEDNFLRQKANTTGGDFWVGGNDNHTEGRWIWDDGRSMQYTNWDDRQPDNSGGIENCLELHQYIGYNWNDVECNDENYFICEGNRTN